MRRSSFLAATCLAAALLAPAAEAAPRAVAITSPTAGTTISRAATPQLAVAGTAAFDPAVAAGKTFFLRGTGCGATEDLFLSASKGTDDYDGCGIIGGIPLNEVIGDPKVLDARDGLPVKLDASKPVQGVIRAESWIGDGIPGVGQVVIDVALSGTTAGGEFADLGSATVTATNAGADGVNVPFTLPVPAELDRTVLTGVSLEVSVHGANYNSSNLGMSGDSKFTLPILDEGVVQVSDSPAFTASKTVTSFVAADGTWSAVLPTPAAGAQTIYARGSQGTSKLSAPAVPITVTP